MECSSRDCRARRRGKRAEIAIAWPDRPKFAQALPPGPFYRALGLDSADAASGLPLCVYDSGNYNALVPVQTVAVLKRATPDWTKLKNLFEKFHLPDNSRITDLHIYCMQARRHRMGDLLLRCRNVFPYGQLEETATGTACVALAAALADHLPALEGGDRAADFTFEQGIGKRRGKIRVRWQPVSKELPRSGWRDMSSQLSAAS